MAAPTFVAEYESTWNTGAQPRTTSVTVAAGDTIVVGVIGESQMALSTPTGGGLTYTLEESVSVSAYTVLSVWTAPCVSSQTFTISCGTDSGTSWFGFNVLRFSGVSAVGASAKTNVASGAPSLVLTTTQTDSAIAVFNGDWQALDGTSRTWRTGAGALTERTYFRDSSHYTTYAGYHANAGPAGGYTVGLSAPAGQKYSIIAVELKGSAGISGVFGQPTETDTATALTESKSRVFGQVAETDTATALVKSKLRGVAQATEADTALPLVGTKSRSFGMPVETDAALSLLPYKSRVLGQAVETDEAFDLGPATGGPLGQAFVTLTAFPLQPTKVRMLGVAVETDTGLALGVSRSRRLGMALADFTALSFIVPPPPRWRLVNPTRLDRYVFEPFPNLRHHVNRVASFTVYEKDGALVAREYPDGNDLAEAEYYWLGGHENITTDPAIRDLWLLNGFEVEHV